jgi:Protein of unknown function (DUF3575)
MKILLSFLCFLYCLTGFAQNTKPVVEFCATCLIDELSFPTVQAGVEFSLSHRLSLYNEIGIKYRKSYYEHSDSGFVGSKGIKLKTELRYHLFKTKKFFKNAYVAVNAFYNYRTYNTTIGYYYQKDTLNDWTDGFGVKKSVYGFNFVLGLKKTIWKKFSFSPYAGVGLRFVNISSVGKEFDSNRDNLQQPIDLTVEGYRQWEDANGKARDNFNFTLGIRLRYQL